MRPNHLAIERFEAACAVAHRAVPKGAKEGNDFAHDCLKGAKVKAELLSKTLPSVFPHHQLLDFSAALIGFDTWDELTRFARKFSTADDAERAGWLHSFTMTTALWRLTPGDESNPVVQEATGCLMAALTGILPGALDQPAAELILRRIMFQKDAEQEYRGRNKRLKQRILHALEGYLGMNPETIVLRLLRRVPVVDRHRASWTSLDNVTVRQLLDTPLANEDHRGGFGFEGWAHAVVDLYQELETVYAKYGPAAETNHLAPDRELKLTRLQSEIESAVSSPLARIVCRDFLNETLKPHLGRSVADVLTHKVDDSGFYASFYSGPPEKVEADWAENYHIHTPGTIKRIAFREPFGDFQLSLFRLRRFFETEGPRLYEFEAVVHDRNDALIAKLGLALFIGEGDTSAEELAWCLDEHDHDDLREVALGLAQACYASRIDEELLDRVMVLRDWEVREDHRGRGLGKKLLNEAVRRSVRGLARPSVLACRLCPARFTIAPYSEWVDEAIRGVDSVVHRELAIPVAELQEIFRRCVGPGSYVAQKGVQSFDAPFLPWLHRNRHDLTLLAMTFARPPAKLRRK